MSEIIVVGGGGHAKVLISILKKLHFEILGYVDIENRGQVLGVSCLGNDAELENIRRVTPKCLVALGIGGVSPNTIRQRISKNLDLLQFTAPAIVSPDAIVNEDVDIASGSVAFDCAVVNSGSRIGRFCIINTNSTIEHDCSIADFVHVAPGATLCGNVKVGIGSMIGAGAIVLPERVICPGCMVGAGAVVTEDCLESGTYVGVPARRRRST